MERELLQWLRCPECKASLELRDAVENDGEVESGALACSCGREYPVLRSIPRFVESDEYTASFSFEWDIHRSTQYDAGGKTASRDTFTSDTNFQLHEMEGKLCLDVGVGSGRFADVVDRAGGIVIGVDFSFAVDAAAQMLKDRPNVHLVQADVFRLPFEEKTFDYIYSIGVLHHTPDCEAAFKCLPGLLKPDGKIAIYVYSAYVGQEQINRAWRVMTTRLPKRLLYFLCVLTVPLHYVWNRYRFQELFWHYVLPGVVFHLVPKIHDYHDWRARLLDTFDWYSPVYQSKHTYPEVCAWFRESGLVDVRPLGPEVCVCGVRPEE
ncbi:MAG: methyltransferase domain-containing protein [Planctomycetes bacterium]|nr:methyltransferase domain-containing protein [Planctomycetota bacterium]